MNATVGGVAARSSVFWINKALGEIRYRILIFILFQFDDF